MFESTKQALTVAELNEYARKLLAGDPLLKNLEVTGEISGYKHHYSGHRYFTLKDKDARVQCVMFRQNAMSLDFQPADGMKVTVAASASIFVRDGSYQLYVTQMRKSGLGDLYARFEQLKSRLSAEGLFDPARKREIPLFPHKIGIVTSETGAAIRDMIRVARRRNPNIGILVAPCAVQGPSAAGEIVKAIRRLNANGECDVLLVGRGGGSIEDLWAFNEEIVARAIAASKIPVISCVGHEIDFTIADFVADLRAPTPSAAAELAVPVLQEHSQALNDLCARLCQALGRGQTVRRRQLDALTSSPVFTDSRQMLIMPKRNELAQKYVRMEAAFRASRANAANRLKLAEGMLRTLNPENVVERGYAIVSKDDVILTNAASVGAGDRLNLKMSGGTLHVLAESVELREGYGKEKADI